MNCNTCNADIPPSFVKALERNICPSCDGPIMLEDTIELMNGLKSALEQMPNDPQGIAGWLLSHYRMQKVGTGEPTGFYGIKNKNGPNSERSDLKIADNPMQRFYKAAGVNTDQAKNKALVAQINGHEANEKDNDFSDLDVQENDEYIPETDDPEYTKQALRAMQNSSGNIKKQMRQHNEPNFDPELEDLHPALHSDRISRLEKQKDLAFGGSVGKIKRS